MITAPPPIEDARSLLTLFVGGERIDAILASDILTQVEDALPSYAEVDELESVEVVALSCSLASVGIVEGRLELRDERVTRRELPIASVHRLERGADDWTNSDAPSSSAESLLTRAIGADRWGCPNVRRVDVGTVIDDAVGLANGDVLVIVDGGARLFAIQTNGDIEERTPPNTDLVRVTRHEDDLYFADLAERVVRGDGTVVDPGLGVHQGDLMLISSPDDTPPALALASLHRRPPPNDDRFDDHWEVDILTVGSTTGPQRVDCRIANHTTMAVDTFTWATEGPVVTSGHRIRACDGPLTEVSIIDRSPAIVGAVATSDGLRFATSTGDLGVYQNGAYAVPRQTRPIRAGAPLRGDRVLWAGEAELILDDGAGDPELCDGVTGIEGERAVPKMPDGKAAFVLGSFVLFVDELPACQ